MEKIYNILLVLCGGTICTSVSEAEGFRTRAISQESGTLLINNFLNSDSSYAGQVNIEASENFGILSENMTVGKWNCLIDYLKGKEGLEQYDGIVFAHGTDTLAYSAALFSVILKELRRPVFLVSANAPLSEEGGNGNANFRAAVELICSGISPGVYVTYRNPSDNKMYLHLGSRLLQCRPYDENFYSKGAVVLDGSDCCDPRKFTKSFPVFRKTQYDALFSYKSMGSLSACVLKIEPCVGLDYSFFNTEGIRAVLHTTYHSGTVCENSSEYSIKPSSDSILSLLDRPGRSYEVYVSPADLKGEIYDSLLNVLKHSGDDGGVHFIYGSTNEIAYVKLLLAYSSDLMSKDEIADFMKTDVCGEIAYGC